MRGDDSGSAAAPGGADEIRLSLESEVWERFFQVAPLVLVGSRDRDGGHDLAPKHMAIPVGHDNYYGFACTPRHATYRNVSARDAFTVSFPRYEQVLEIALAAGPRTDEGTKPSLAALTTRPAHAVDGVLVDGCAAWLECERHAIVDGLGGAAFIIGRVVAASVAEDALRAAERDDAELIFGCPPIAYLHPLRIAQVAETTAMPFPRGFRW